jgi:hypothetical protein
LDADDWGAGCFAGGGGAAGCLTDGDWAADGLASGFLEAIAKRIIQVLKIV